MTKHGYPRINLDKRTKQELSGNTQQETDHDECLLPLCDDLVLNRLRCRHQRAADSHSGMTPGGLSFLCSCARQAEWLKHKQL
jgi:hypothetical protein